MIMCAVVAAGCGGQGRDEGNAATGPAALGPGADEGARTLPIPGASGAVPEGHPPIDDRSGEASAGPIHWEAPAGWVQVQPSSNMRYAQYRVSGSGGEAECVVFYFGPGQGGDPVSNAQRWAGQFEQPDGSSSLEKMSMNEIAGGQVPLTLVDVTGTYTGGMTMTAAPAEKEPGWMLLGGIAEGPDAPWFFKLTGPEATLREQRDAFVEMLRSIHHAH